MRDLISEALNTDNTQSWREIVGLALVGQRFTKAEIAWAEEYADFKIVFADENEWSSKPQVISLGV